MALGIVWWDGGLLCEASAKTHVPLLCCRCTAAQFWGGLVCALWSGRPHFPSNSQAKAIYLITGGKQPDKKQKAASAFESKKLQIQTRIDNLDKVRRFQRLPDALVQFVL